MSAKEGIVTELHRQARKNFPRRSVYIKGIDDIWQCDLVDMQPHAKQNRGYKYILTIIDALSKYAWAVPVRDKRGDTITAAMRRVLSQNQPRFPVNIQCDQGREFFNSHFQALMKQYGINMYTTYSHLKASIVERFNRTLKSWMFKEFGIQGNYKWLDILPKLLLRYNARVHRSIGMRPKQVTSADESTLLQKLRSTGDKKKRKLKYSIGDTVRISKYKTLFAKGYTPNWSTELFTIDDIRLSRPPVYYLRDTRGERIKGAFYEQELQKTKYPDTYLVEKVLRRKGNRMFVRWLGLNKTFDSWLQNVPTQRTK